MTAATTTTGVATGCATTRLWIPTTEVAADPTNAASDANTGRNRPAGAAIARCCRPAAATASTRQLQIDRAALNTEIRLGACSAISGVVPTGFSCTCTARPANTHDRFVGCARDDRDRLTREIRRSAPTAASTPCSSATVVTPFSTTSATAAGHTTHAESCRRD